MRLIPNKIVVRFNSKNLQNLFSCSDSRSGYCLDNLLFAAYSVQQLDGSIFFTQILIQCIKEHPLVLRVVPESGDQKGGNLWCL
jgi:hypothetical protein